MGFCSVVLLLVSFSAVRGGPDDVVGRERRVDGVDCEERETKDEQRQRESEAEKQKREKKKQKREDEDVKMKMKMR